jgi:nitrogen fixation/metabolism regulation signal transduction histidine kinase
LVATETPPDLGGLRVAFDRFSEAAQALEEQQRALEARIDELNLELAESNHQLAVSLEAQGALANSLHNVLENLTAGVIAIDASGVVTSANDAALRLLRCRTREELVGLPAVRGVGERLGTPLIAELIDSGWGTTRAGEIAIGTDSEPAHIRLRGSPAQDVQTGEPWGGIVVIEDITALIRWRERALLNQRLSTMGQVAAQIAHEIRNPLGSIELLASALKSELAGQPGRPTEFAGHIVSVVHSIDALVSNILLFARGREPEVAPVTWEQIAEAALSQTRHLIEQAGAEIEQRWMPRSPAVLGDADLLRQALVNLLINATQAVADTSDAPIITLETAATESEATIRIADTGPGVPEDLRERIFDPFVTTRRRGTGLGLAIVSHIVAAHGGRVTCGEREGGGAVFGITLPLAGAAAVDTGGEHA